MAVRLENNAYGTAFEIANCDTIASEGLNHYRGERLPLRKIVLPSRWCIANGKLAYRVRGRVKAEAIGETPKSRLQSRRPLRNLFGCR